MIVRLALTGGLASVVVLFATGCEDKTLGRSCDVAVDAGPSQGAWNTGATDCPSQICIKPAVQAGASTNTTAYCTAQCSSDNDCNGQTRDTSNPNDKRCAGGFTCAVVFGQGPGQICCRKLCLCRDFIAPTGPVSPAACQDSSSPSCPSES
jgi:hypothetical protein